MDRDIGFFTTLIRSKEYSITLKKVMVCHYFNVLCNQKEYIDLLKDKRIQTSVRSEIIKCYKRKKARSNKYLEETIHEIINNSYEDNKEFNSDCLMYLSIINPAYLYDCLDNHKLINDKFVYGKFLLSLVSHLNNDNNLSLEVLKKILANINIYNHQDIYLNKLFYDIVYIYSEYLLESIGKKYILEESEQFRGKGKINYFINEIYDHVSPVYIKIYERNPQLKTTSLISSLPSKSKFECNQPNEELLLLKNPIHLGCLVINDEKERLETNHSEVRGFYSFYPCSFEGKINSIISVYTIEKQKIEDIILLSILSKYVSNEMKNINNESGAQKYYTNFLQVYDLVMMSLKHETSKAISDLTDAMQDLDKTHNISHGSSIINNIDSAKTLIDEIVQSLTSLVGEKNEKVRINTIINNTVESIGPINSRYNINYRYDLCNKDPLVDTKSIIFVILINLIKNSINAFNSIKAENRYISIETKTIESSSTLEIFFSDNGPGIDPEIKPYIFDLGVTTSGSGVGLALVRLLVDAASGHISLNENDIGASFQIIFPLEA